MNFKAIFNSTVFLKSVFALALIILVFISSFSYFHTLSFTNTSKWVFHSYRVSMELEQLESHIKDAEARQRGFNLTNDSVFVQGYFQALNKVNNSLAKLDRLVAGRLQQRNNLDSLRKLVALRIDLLKNAIEETPEEPLESNKVNLYQLLGKNMMDRIHLHIRSMLFLETVYLKEHEKKYNDQISFAPWLTFLLLFFSLIIFVAAYLKINRNLHILKKANKRLVIISESFQQAEEIGNFSSWQWDLDSKEMIFSDNHYRLLGCRPQSFEPSIENFIDFVHPEDKHVLIEKRDKIISGKQLSAPAFFRIIKKNGDLRYFKSVGKVLTDIQGKKMFIGINRDVTIQYLRSRALEERNHELEQSNKELASFNHIASHDLQEPLRKIQTFISRIAEKEDASLSEKGKEYFLRIQSAATRMRVLIDDLLLFSRSNKAEKNFELQDLNLVLENVKIELAVPIEERKALVYSEELPVLSVIPFQMQQLFVNLISNSLKYGQQDRPPVIHIYCKIIIASEEAVLKSESYKKFYKITVSDNGIGFEKEHAENIFVLFHRLHHLTEYSGTGIGLAICKKIVENHNGYIFAEAELNVGASFIIYLPK
ncbi:MAG: CHASE3 domain-containing protein [Bacteroidota bacterium]